MIGYTEEIELKMHRLFERLSEKDRRCYAAIEAAKLDHGGTEYISKLFENVSIQQPDANQADNGILTALEVLSLDLENTDLVTLSACQTALGNIQIGEGVYSLNRAFQEAGAKAVLSTLWKVDDGVSGQFMQSFYADMLNGIPAQQALQNTQNTYIGNESFKDPYLWAGFSMMGL